MLSFARGNSKPHIIDLAETAGYVKVATLQIASGGIERKLGKVDLADGTSHDFSLVDHRLLKTLEGFLDGTFQVSVRLSGVIDKPAVVYRGPDIAKAVEAYNDLQ